MTNKDKLAQEKSVYVFLKLLGLEELVVIINEFYKRLPKALIFKTPSIYKLIEISFYRVTHSIMNPKIVEQSKNALPIKMDFAGYFFPTPELESLRTSSVTGNSSSPDRESVLKELKVMLARGLNTFRDLPMYRYLAASLGAFDTQEPLKSRIQGIAETFPILIRHTQMLDMYAKQGKGRSIAEDVNKYERPILQRMRAAALVLQALHFDLANLFLGTFTDESIERIIHEEFGELFDDESSMSLFFVLINPRVYEHLKKEKKKYLESKKLDIDNRLYAPLALWIYRQGLVLDSDITKAGVTKLNNLKTREFLQYNALENYRGYVECIRCKKDLRSKVHSAVYWILKKTHSTKAITHYLEIFWLLENRDDHFINTVTGKIFINLWAHAYSKGWSSKLASNIGSLGNILDNQNILDVLMQQNSGKLILMLTHHGFRDYLKRSDIKKSDFENLYEIFFRDKIIFEQVYYYTTTEDRNFLQALVKLMSKGAYDTTNIIITDKMKKFVTSLRNHDATNAKEIIQVLKNFHNAQRAVLYKYTPFSGNLEDMKDKADFSRWFFKNEKTVLKGLALADAVSPYLGDSTSLKLQEALVQLFQKHSDEFCSKYLKSLRLFKESQSLPDQTYLRIVIIFISLINAKRLCRKREIVKVLQCLAFTLPTSEWSEFSKKFVQINGNALSDYKGLFEEYHASAILKIVDIRADMQGIKILAKTYGRIKEAKQRSLIDLLIEILGKIEVPLTVIKNICFHINQKQYEITKFIISEFKKGKSPEETLKAISVYKDDEEFLKFPPDTLL